MRQLIAGNWKMNGTRALAVDIGRAAAEAASSLPCDLLICPPATLIAPLAEALRGAAAGGASVAVGAQDCHQGAAGPHTGDVHAAALREAGAGWVILGHSERRADHGETDPLVNAKAVAAADAGLVPVVCVGETEQQRLSGNAELVVASQLEGSIPPGFAGVVAYEPVWAIGTGRTATEADVVAMHAAIRNQLTTVLGARAASVRILYGGSVKPDNAASLLALPEVGGALVGGASLSAAHFLAIARAARPA